MSRAGKPTDNPVNESLNGWIKEEIISDFNLNVRRYMPFDEFEGIIRKYVRYYNTQRPSYAIGYDTPEHFRKRYYDNEMPHKESFKDRELSSEPKFVRKRRQKTNNQGIGKKVSTFGNQNG